MQEQLDVQTETYNVLVLIFSMYVHTHIYIQTWKFYSFLIPNSIISYHYAAVDLL